MARFWRDVKATLGTMPASLMRFPAWMTSSCPLGERGTSTHPVNCVIIVVYRRCA